MKSFLVALLITVCSAWHVGAKTNIDSLTQLVRKEKNDVVKITLLGALCEQYRSYAIDSFHVYALQTVALAKKLQQPYYNAISQCYLGLYYYRKGNIDSLTPLLENISHIKLDNDPKSTVVKNKMKLLRAGYFMKLNKQQEAMRLYYDVLENAVSIKDSFSYMLALNGVGWSNMELERFDDAITWLQKGIAIKTSSELERLKGLYYINISSCYGSLGKIELAQKSVEEGLRIAKRYDDLLLHANGLNILSNIYLHYQKPNKAIECLTEATAIRKKTGDPFYIVSDMSQLSVLYFDINEHQKAINLVLEAIAIATKENITAKLPLLYDNLSEMYYKSHDYQKAYDALQTLIDLKEQQYQKAPAEKLKELEVKYETSIKENIIQKQQFQLSQKNYLLWSSTLLLGLAIVIGLMGIRNYKHKSALRVQTALAIQKEENTKAILDAEEKERTRLASELHDGLGPMLSTVKYNLSGMKSITANLENGDKELFRKTIHLLDESCKEVRQVSHSIMPNALLKNGLESALRDFTTKIGNNQIKINLTTDLRGKKIDSQIAVATYRIIQECINNVIKHAQATQVDISVIKDEDGLSATIEDNGKGFLLKEKQEEGIGLKNMAARIRYLQGSFEIDSRPGNGTLIAFHIP